MKIAYWTVAGVFFSTWLALSVVADRRGVFRLDWQAVVWMALYAVAWPVPVLTYFRGVIRRTWGL